MEKISFHGNRAGIMSLIFMLILAFSMCVTTYKAKKITEIKKLDIELEAYEANLEKENQKAIKGIKK